MGSQTQFSGRQDVGSAALPPISSYLPVGCLVSDGPSTSLSDAPFTSGWIEIDSSSPEFGRCQLGVQNEPSVRRLLKASCLRLFAKDAAAVTIYRVYWLPDDVARVSIPRDSKRLLSDAELVLSVLLVSPQLWRGDELPAYSQAFDCYAQKEEGSLFYIFNSLSSPNPHPEQIRDRFSRAAAEDILNHTTALPGLKTQLYPYQARSAAAMVQLESSTELHDDARFEQRVAPDGSRYFFVPRLCQFYRQPQHYASNRGGILAETMGLG
jgi:hypothetical protein